MSELAFAVMGKSGMGVTGSSAWDEAWAWWSGLANFETRTALPGELKLGRMLAILQTLGNPHRASKVIHVTGTKGKGSTSAMIESVLRQAGFRTGLYSSPHLVDVTERFQINGLPAGKPDLAQAVQAVREVVESYSHPVLAMGPPTFFEVATAAAFLIFQKHKIEYVVLEVGLGGRLDSTNICEPVCSVITTVGLDHTKILGDTIEKIAWEKAGIIKAGVPVVSGVLQKSAREIIHQEAREQKAFLWEIHHQIHYKGHSKSWWQPDVLQEVDVTTPLGTYRHLPCPLAGEHQWQNLACAVGALDRVLGPANSSRPDLYCQGLKNTKWPGRLEILRRDPLVLIDGAHNPDSAAALAHTIKGMHWKGKKRLIVGISADKDQKAILEILAPLADEMTLTRYSSGQRATPPEVLLEAMPSGYVGKVQVVDHPHVAWKQVMGQSDPSDLIVITGSLFLVGELRGLILGPGHSNP